MALALDARKAKGASDSAASGNVRHLNKLTMRGRRKIMEKWGMFSRPLTTAIIGFGMISATANATVILDQDSGGPSGFTTTRCLGCARSILDVAQTFTVGRSGTLARIEVDQVFLDLDNGGSLSGFPLVFDIRRTSAGLPVADDSLALSTLSLPPGSMPTRAFSGSLVFNILSFGLTVNEGDVLSFVLRSNGNVFAFATSDAGNVYARGEYAQRFSPGDPFPHFTAPSFPDGTDMSFRSLVNVPEPSLLALMELGLTGLAFARRKRLTRNWS
jgi:hypothetical protein